MQKLLLVSVFASSVILFTSLPANGCGDKLLVLGRSLRFQTMSGTRPAGILAYAPPDTPSAEAITEIQGVFEPGQEYELYRAVKTILGFAAHEIFIIDPYINAEMFEVYADSIPRTVLFRLLTNSANIPSAVLSLAQKYAAAVISRSAAALLSTTACSLQMVEFGSAASR